MNRNFRLSHVGLLGAAPVVHAQASGAFEREGLQCDLRHEIGDTTVLERLLDGSIDAICAPATLALAHGLTARDGSAEWFVHTVLSRDGYGLVVAPAVADLLAAPRPRPMPTLRIGVPTTPTAARLLVQRWFGGLAHPNLPEPRCIPVPISQMIDFLAEDVIDGFCADDPLPGIAAIRHFGRLVATSSSLAPDHPHTVLLSPSFSPLCSLANRRALARALAPSQAFCADPARRPAVLQTMLALVPARLLPAADLARLLSHPAAGPHPWFSSRFEPPQSPATLTAADRAFLEESVLAAVGTSGRRAQVRTRVERIFPGGLVSAV